MNADGLPGIRRAPQPLPVEVEYVLAPARVLRRPPWGEGVPRPAFSSAGAGRVRGYFHSQTELLRAQHKCWSIQSACEETRNSP